MNELNIGWFYYKEYFRNVDYSGLLEEPQQAAKFPSENGKSRNEQLLDVKYAYIPKLGKEYFIQAKVSYPGLVTGVGIGHEAKIEGEFKLGMHFDYTYGMPIIYGSSVKGLLRSMFEQEDYIKEKFGKFGITEVSVLALKKNIFEGIDGKGKLLSIYERDIFYDAVIVKPNKKGRILEQDALAPHGKNPLKNPQPLMFIKIASGVTIEFRFDLREFEVSKGIKVTPEQKLGLFKEILADVGIGAKTNVGYGQLEILEEEKKEQNN